MTIAATRAPASWLAPRSVAGAVALFAAGYAVIQSVFALLLHAMFRAPLPAAGFVGWLGYAAAAGGLGAAAGAAWRLSRPRPGRAARFGGQVAQLVPASATISARVFAETPVLTWYATVVATAVVTAALFAWVGRFLGPALRSPGA